MKVSSQKDIVITLAIVSRIIGPKQKRGRREENEGWEGSEREGYERGETL